jgi:lysozyme
MRTSAYGVEFIAAYEGFIDHPYRDSGGVWTIGYGHTGPGVAQMSMITRATALALLASDVRGAEQAVSALGLRLTQGEFDALVSFAFNCGPGTLEPSRSLGSALRQRGMRGVPAAMRLYTRDARGNVLAGLLKRRQAEATMFRRPGAKGPADWLTPNELRRCRELDELRDLDAPTAAQARRLLDLVSLLTAQRKRIWHLAQPSPRGDAHGWDYRHRRHRYQSLLARTV